MQAVSRLISSFRPETYSLDLSINRIDRLFSGTVTITGEIFQKNSLRLHAKGLKIIDVYIDELPAKHTLHENDEIELTVDGLAPGPHGVLIKFQGKITDQMHGMYPCYFEHGGVKKELIATQFESHHAREVFPCVDEPEAKATFDVTLRTETGVVVLGNMPVKTQDKIDGRLTTVFETTPRMSSYLLAWVVGELHKKTATTKGGVQVNVWATPAQQLVSLDFALDIATRSIDFFDEYFGIPYPLPKSDHVALPDFSSGAMENWGLITYREIALLADHQNTSVSSKRYIATVITHELSHQWFGNLVTMKWWNNLWLNESFANLMEYIAVDALHPEWNIWLDYSSSETIMALRRDALDGVQAVQTEVKHPDEISTLFDGAIVYAKGGRLLRMLQYYIGHDAFKTGLRNYFKKYAYQNTDGDDLWRELSAASGKNISDFMNTWITQSGFPVVHVHNDKLVQEQFFVGPHKKSTKIWPIPLEASVPTTPRLMKTKTLDVNIKHGERLNVGDTAHFITHYTPEHLAEIVVQSKSGGLDPVSRLQLLHEQSMLARGNVISSAELIPLLTSYKDETIESVWDIVALSFGELKKFVETEESAELKLRQLSSEVARKQFERLGWHHNGEPEADTKLRAIILNMTLYGEEKEVIEKANAVYDTLGIDKINPELRSLIIGAKIRHFESPPLIDSLLDLYVKTPSADLKTDICIGLTSTRNNTTIRKLLHAMTNSAIIRSQDVAQWFVYLIRRRESRELTWLWMKNNWQWIEDTYSGDKSFDYFVRYAASGLVNKEQSEDYKKFFTPKMKDPSLKRVIQIGIGEIEGRVSLIERDGPAVRDALLKL